MQYAWPHTLKDFTPCFLTLQVSVWLCGKYLAQVQPVVYGMLMGLDKGLNVYESLVCVCVCPINYLRYLHSWDVSGIGGVRVIGCIAVF